MLEPFRENEWGQLGSLQFPKMASGNVPFPVELHIPGVHVVSLAASDESVQIPLLSLHISLTLYIDRAFHALSSDGSVYVWGGCL